MNNVVTEIESYVKDCLTIKHDRSLEYYFGENNSLRLRLIDWISDIRETISSVSKNNQNFTPKDGLEKIKDRGKYLSKIICDEFNIEGCTVGWCNTINACCYSQIGNSDLFGNSDDAKDRRIKLNDIVDTKNGFKYKNKKGLYYVVCLGYPVFCIDTIFTVEEAAAILVHELGHAMQHVVNSFNQTVCISIYRQLYNELKFNDDLNYNPAYKRYVKQMFKRLRNDIRTNNKADFDKVVNDFLNDSKQSDGFSFSKTDEERIQGIVGMGQDWELNNDKYQEQRMKKVAEKKAKFSTKVKQFFRSIFNTVLIVPAIFQTLRMSSMNSKVQKDKDINLFKIFEETADDFCQMYGLGLAQASAMKKFDQFGNNMNVNYGNLMEKIPILDFYWSYKEMMDDYECALHGYPSDKQRMLNLYRSAKFELQNNKDLSQASKAELSKQLEDYKTIYDEFVKSDAKKGWLYKLMAGLSRDKIEEEAKKDPFIYRNVLIPLQKRMDPSFDPYEEYSDIME